jgi:hypothetical protein
VQAEVGLFYFEDMRKAKEVYTILLGAGFPTIWGGLLTTEITRRVRYQLLEGTKYYLEDERQSSVLKSQYRNFFSQLFNDSKNFEIDLSKLEFDFSPCKKDVIKLARDCKIIEGEMFIMYEDANHYQVGEGFRFFFQDLHAIYLRKLQTHFGYLETSGQDKFMNEPLGKWLHRLCENYNLRIYSLNYDRCIPLLFPELAFFEGFNPEGIFSPENDALNNAYFNLHGSFYFQQNIEDNSRLDELRLFPQPTKINYQTIPPYIAGSTSKDLKIGSQPVLKYFADKLNSDLKKSSKLCCIGYSGGDQHIEKALLKFTGEFKNVNLSEPNQYHPSASITALRLTTEEYLLDHTLW